MSSLQSKTCQTRSNPVKVNQSELNRRSKAGKCQVNQALRIACLALLLALAGCTRSEPPADLVMINGPDPETLDPALVTSIEGLRVSAGLFEGLARNDPVTAAPIPGLAARWEISAGWLRLYLSPARQPALDGRGADHGAGRCVFLAAGAGSANRLGICRPVVLRQKCRGLQQRQNQRPVARRRPRPGCAHRAG